MSRNFVNFHVLISHSPSCLNRDDMNMQKSAVFGGKRRVRISSQSLKRTMRRSDYYLEHLGQPSTRSRDLPMIREYFLKTLGDTFDAATISRAVDCFVGATASAEDGDNEAGEDAAADKDRKLAVAPWVTEELAYICGLVREVCTAGLTADEREKAEKECARQKKPKKGEKKTVDWFLDQMLNKKIEERVKANRAALLAAIGSARDVALSGRMATSGLMTTVDGALAVAHVLTTHAVDADIDWFTAVDDLNENGSGHLDTQEFSSGVFYRYASLNLKQLQVNLGLLPELRAEETAASRRSALAVAAHVLHLLATEVPSAKQQTFAAHNLADLVMVSLADLPVSLANAFEEPVRPGPGFLKPSIQALHAYWQAVHAGYGLNEVCAEFSLGHKPPEGMAQRKTLGELEAWLASDGGGTP